MILEALSPTWPPWRLCRYRCPSGRPGARLGALQHLRQGPAHVVKAGQVVKVKVLEVDLARQRIALTMRMGDEPKKHDGGNSASAARRCHGSKARHNAPAPSGNAMAAAFAKLRSKRPAAPPPGCLYGFPRACRCACRRACRFSAFFGSFRRSPSWRATAGLPAPAMYNSAFAFNRLNEHGSGTTQQYLQQARRSGAARRRATEVSLTTITNVSV